MYPVYCIALTGQTNYITQPISLDDNNCEWYLLLWEPCLQNVQHICFFQLFHISQCLRTDNNNFFLFHSNNVHHDVFVPRELLFPPLNGCIRRIPFSRIWWHLLSHNGRSIFWYNYWSQYECTSKKNFSSLLGTHKRSSTDISENAMYSDKKTNIICGI